VGGITVGETTFGGHSVLVILPNPEEIDDYRKPYEIPKTGRRKQGEKQ
jgi:hypothetical protein